MSPRLKVTNLALATVAATTLLLAGCGGGDSSEAQAADAERTPGLAVRVETLRPRPMIDAITVAGIIKAEDDVMISPEEGGVVKAWVVPKGGRVRSGQTIAVLKDEVVRASYEAALAQYNIAQMNLDKQRKVYEEQGISELQFRNLQYARDAAKANADLMKARLDRTQITSPVDGILEQHFSDQGEFAPPGMPIAQVVNISRLKVQAEIPEKYVGSVREGTGTIITFDAFAGDTVRSNISYVSSTVSASNRALTVEAVIPNTGRTYKPEMIAKVKVLRESKQAALLVSENVVQLVDLDKHVVFVEENGKAVERVVRLGGRQDNLVEIVDGLRPGDRVIVTGVQKLVNGLSVDVSG